MQFNFKRRTLLALAAMSLAGAAQAADWPTKPITLVVPFVAGGTTDIISRIAGEKLGEALHQPVIIDNRGGAGGTLGAAVAAKAPADGYTFFMATIAHAIAPALYSHLSYDFIKDLDPVALVAITPNVLIVNPALPVKSVPELIAYIKSHPGQVNYGSAGSGSTEHLSGALFASLTHTDITHVPYKGGAPMMTDLMGGQIQMAIETSPSAAQSVRANRVRALAVTTAKPSPAYPGIPTLAEAGVPGYEFVTWFALMAPHGTPKAIVDRVSNEIANALKQPDVMKKFDEQGVMAGDMGPQKLGAFIKTETVKWGKVARESGAKID